MEVVPGPRAVLVRDTEDARLGSVLVLDHAAWTAFRDAALGGPREAADLVIVRSERTTRHARGAVRTTWHVTLGDRTLHFTDAEWDAFAAGVRAGEFASAPSAG